MIFSQKFMGIFKRRVKMNKDIIDLKIELSNLDNKNFEELKHEVKKLVIENYRLKNKVTQLGELADYYCGRLSDRDAELKILQNKLYKNRDKHTSTQIIHKRLIGYNFL